MITYINSNGLNTTIKEVVKPINSLLDTLELFKSNDLSQDDKIKMVHLMPNMINSARDAVNTLIN